MTKALQTTKTGPAYGLETVDRIFNNAMRRFFDGNLWDNDTSTNQGVVPVNVRETENQYELDVIAPGCRKEDFNVQVKDNELVVSFTHSHEQNENNQQAGWVRNEYVQQSFVRNFTLDHTIDTEKISATYTDGILRVVLPKNEKARPVSIAINVK